MNGGERKNEKMKNVSKNICDETKKYCNQRKLIMDIKDQGKKALGNKKREKILEREREREREREKNSQILQNKKQIKI